MRNEARMGIERCPGEATSGLRSATSHGPIVIVQHKVVIEQQAVNDDQVMRLVAGYRSRQAANKVWLHRPPCMRANPNDRERYER